MVFAGEKVREIYPEPTPELGAFRNLNGVRLSPVADLIKMKLSSFRL